MIGSGNMKDINDTEGWTVFIFERHDVFFVQTAKGLPITGSAQTISWTVSPVMRFIYLYEGKSYSVACDSPLTRTLSFITCVF